MNLINASLIDLLVAAAETFRNEVCRILEQYKTDRNREKQISQRYKDESGYFKEQQYKLATYAREMIAKAERVFCSKVDDYSKQMEEQLKKHLSMPVNSQFREKLSMLSDFDIKPERIEIEDLLSLNGGNQIGLTALAKTLEKVDSPYILKYHTTSDYQSDIGTIRGIKRNLKYIPIEYHHEGCEIYEGITADYVNPDGSRIGGKIIFDSVSLLTSAIGFESEIEKIKAMKDVWAADCSYEEADQDAAEARADMKLTNKYLTDAGLPAEENEEPKTQTRIEDNFGESEGISIAKELGNNLAKARQTYEELKKAGQML